MRPHDAGCRLTLRVLPNAGRTGFVLRDDGTLVLRLMAPAVEGKANAALTRWLARDLLGLSKSSVRLVSGQRSRIKTLEIDADPLAVRRCIAADLA